jgi:hypothetical protein
MRCVSSNGNENPPVHLAHITNGPTSRIRDGDDTTVTVSVRGR